MILNSKTVNLMNLTVNSISKNVFHVRLKTGFSQIKIFTDNIFHLAVIFFIRPTVVLEHHSPQCHNV